MCGPFSPVQITETRRALRDSESGLEKMAIGHHIQDRGHVVEKKHNKKTGEKELNQDFHNMDECKFRGTSVQGLSGQVSLSSKTLCRNRRK